jgi:hypothetical protein
MKDSDYLFDRLPGIIDVPELSEILRKKFGPPNFDIAFIQAIFGIRYEHPQDTAYIRDIIITYRIKNQMFIYDGKTYTIKEFHRLLNLLAFV